MPYTPYEKQNNEVVTSVADKSEFLDKINRRDDEDMESFLIRIQENICWEESHQDEKGLNELTEENVAVEYARGKGKREMLYHYPDTMFPELLDKSSANVAFLITELYFSDESFHIEDFYSFFRSYPNRHYPWSEMNTGHEQATSLKARVSHMCAGLKDRSRFLEEFQYKSGDDTSITSCIVAKIVYPYMVRIE